MKVTIEYQPTDTGKVLGADGPIVLKLGLPKSWVAGNALKVKSFFLEEYKKKYPSCNLDPGMWHLVAADGRPLGDDAPVVDHVSAGDELRVAPGPPPPVTAPRPPKPVATPAPAPAPTPAAAAAADPSLLTCRNYGCLKQYREAENGEEACKHHSAPPIFHEGKKAWACCKHKAAWDWDDFMKIEPCCVGRHSTVDPKVTFAPSPTVAAAAAAAASSAGSSSSSAAAAPAAAVPSGVKSIDGFNASNPDAVTAASSAAKTMSSQPKASRRAEDGAYRCTHKGCSAYFQLEDNAEGSCRYHASQPVFHDAKKYWACCPDSVAYDFETFMAIPGCVTGKHDPGQL